MVVAMMNWDGHSPGQRRGRSPHRRPLPVPVGADAGAGGRSRDSSPNWSDLSDESPSRPAHAPFLPSSRFHASPGRRVSPSPSPKLHNAQRHPPGAQDFTDQLPGKPHHGEEIPLQECREEPSGRAWKGGRRSPLRGGGGIGLLKSTEAEAHFFASTGLSEETATARLEVACAVLHVLAAGLALMQLVPMALVVTRWQYKQERCPLFVDVPPGFRIHWGNPDLTPCKTTAFLPLLVVALSFTLAAFHYCVMRNWQRSGQAPAAAVSGMYAWVTLVLVLLEALVTLCATLVLTEGFRQTCISFDLSLSWDEKADTCKQNYDGRDAAYSMTQLHTFDKVVTALVGGWACVIVCGTLVVMNTVRARLCRCQLLCV